MASRRRKMVFSVVSMALVEPVTDCELIVAAAEPGSRDTKLSHPGCNGKLVGASLLKLYSNEVVGL
jgi:hypothetical protein